MKKKLLTLACGLVALTTAVVAGTGIAKAEGAAETTIENGVYIGGIDVGGMTESEAKTAIDSYINSLMNTTFTFVGAEGSMELSASEMGVTADADSAVEEAISVGHNGNLINRFKEVQDLKKENITVSMHLGIDKQATAQAIYNNLADLNIEASDASLTRENGAFVYVPGVEGKEVNIVNSVNQFDEYLTSEWDGTSTQYNLVVDVVSPRGSQEELAKIKDVLGSFSTGYATSGAERAHNVEHGCAKINGTIIYPGEEFSMYDVAGPMTLDNGYEMAGAYENGEVVQAPGGGICQVATTLYNAAIRAELTITKRFNHSMLVSYVDPSDDAAIAGDYKNLCFVNDYDTPVYIEGYCAGRVISFVIYGVETRPVNRTISFVSETLETFDKDTEFVLSDELEAGTVSVTAAHQGTSARLWKVVSVDGVEQSREIFNTSKYNASAKVLTIGTKGASEDAIKAIKKAIKSKDEDAVKAAAAAAKPDSKDDKKKDKDKKKDDEDSDSSDDDDSSSETDPGTTDPGATDPGTTDPGTTDPGTTDTAEGAGV